MGAGVVPKLKAPGNSRAIPTTGMRGGLGRTLLTAFLILAILPLALIGSYAAQQNRRNLEAEVATKLLAVATLKGEKLLLWIEDVSTLLRYALDAGGDEGAGVTYDSVWANLHGQVPGLAGALALDRNQNLLWSTGDCQHLAAPTSTAGDIADLETFAVHYNDPFVSLPISYHGQNFIFCFDAAVVQRVLQSDVGLGGTGNAYLLCDSRLWPENEPLAPMHAQQVSAFSAPGNAAISGNTAVSFGGRNAEVYENHHGVRVIGVYYPLPGHNLGVLVEQDEAEVMQSTERIAATLIAMVLAVALSTTAIAAVVIRQITRPVIELTESAVAMAEGDLDQHLAVKSRDEIGILTYVFNEMAADLKSLYQDLEAKVAERTQKLQSANYQIQRRALHLQASQEVSQAITSVRDPELLLRQVTDLIRDRFVYSKVAVYLVAPGGGELYLRARSPRASEMRTSDAMDNQAWPAVLRPGDGSVVERAVRRGISQVDTLTTRAETEWYDRKVSRLAVPLKMEPRVVGAIAVQATTLEIIQPDELEVLELLANQVTIALENARAYERERQAMEQMEAAEAFKARFLANMSHELREPLNTVIGFSRLLLKGVEGELTAQQRQDLEQIYGDSQRLLFLINDILAISQIQAGLMELRLQPVNLLDMVAGVMPTADALVRGKEVALVQEIPANLPLLNADPARLRQVLVHLLNNAAKFTEQGEIKLQAWLQDENVYVSVSDTGIGIPAEDRDRIFTHFERGRSGRRAGQGAGLGLALCKEFVELHGGQIWVHSEVQVGSTFTFSIPMWQDR